MDRSFTAPVGAVKIGSYFATQYYHVLQQQPQILHQFYSKRSSAVLVNGKSSELATELLQIHNLVTSHNFTSIEIKTINSLESWSKSILVVVSGSVLSKDFSGRRKFVQTFLLAPQDQGYFVLNDIFHLVDDEVIDKPPAPEVSEKTFGFQPTISGPVQEHPAFDYTYEDEATDYLNSVHIGGHNPEEEYNFQEYQEEYEPEREVEEEDILWDQWSAFPQSTVNKLQESIRAVDERFGEPKKFSYASILQAAKDKPAPSLSTQPLFTRSTPTTSGLQNSISDVSKEGLLHAEADLLMTSVYVKNLPRSVTTFDVLEKFMTFGKIKKDGVAMKPRLDGGNGFYAFVEFEDIQGAQNAIQASPLWVAGRQAYVEERKPSITSTFRGPRRGGGGRSGGQGKGGNNGF